MRIDSYKFGEIVIEGVCYSSDIIICRGVIKDNWRRKAGHTLSVEDIKNIISAKPSMLLIGCGAAGMMKVTDEVKKALQKAGLKFEVHKTAKAVERFNEIAEKDTDIAAALHLTC